MNKKVFIKQYGAIPGYRIIEELESRGGFNSFALEGRQIGAYYYINVDDKIFATEHIPPEYYNTELLYNKETDSFYEKPQRMVSAEAKENLLTDAPALASTERAINNMLKGLKGDSAILNIPEGYEATIEDGKIVVRKKKWQPKEGDMVWYVYFEEEKFEFDVYYYTFHGEPVDLDDFKTEKEARAFCDKLNDVIKPIVEERRKEVVE